jgi:hypothetical protein
MSSGMRRGEACARRWADIDGRGGTVLVDESVIAAPWGGRAIKAPKTRASIRRVALDADTVEALGALRRMNEGDWEGRLAGAGRTAPAAETGAGDLLVPQRPSSPPAAFRGSVAQQIDEERRDQPADRCTGGRISGQQVNKEHEPGVVADWVGKGDQSPTGNAAGERRAAEPATRPTTSTYVSATGPFSSQLQNPESGSGHIGVKATRRTGAAPLLGPRLPRGQTREPTLLERSAQTFLEPVAVGDFERLAPLHARTPSR